MLRKLGQRLVRGASLLVVSATTLIAQEFTPPRLKGGDLPAQPPQATAGGQVWLEAAVNTDGTIKNVRPLRVTPPYDALTRAAVEGWTFDPARANTEPEPVPARVLVAAVFQPPTLYAAPGLGEPPRDTATASEEIPFPTTTALPVYPVTAVGDAMVLMELLVGPDGTIRGAAVSRSGGAAFDDSALNVAKQWTFRPARRSGLAVASYVYLIFGFRAPVVSPPPRPR